MGGTEGRGRIGAGWGDGEALGGDVCNVLNQSTLVSIGPFMPMLWGHTAAALVHADARGTHCSSPQHHAVVQLSVPIGPHAYRHLGRLLVLPRAAIEGSNGRQGEEEEYGGGWRLEHEGVRTMGEIGATSVMLAAAVPERSMRPR